MTDNTNNSMQVSLLYEMAESLSSLVIREHQILQDEMSQVSRLVEDAVKELGGSFREFNVCVTEQSSIVESVADDNNKEKLNGLSSQLRGYTSTMKRALQFDDIVQQLAGHASERLSKMQELFVGLEEEVAKLKLKNNTEGSETEENLKQMLGNISKFRQLLEKENPVKQESMAAGEIELF